MRIIKSLQELADQDAENAVFLDTRDSGIERFQNISFKGLNVDLWIISRNLNAGLYVTHQKKAKAEPVKSHEPGSIPAPLVGQEVFVTPDMNQSRVKKEPFKAVVVSVGRKYFTIKSGSEITMRLYDWKDHNPVYISMYQAWVSEEEYLDSVEANAIAGILANQLGAKFGERSRYTVEQLRKVADILGLDETPEGWVKR